MRNRDGLLHIVIILILAAHCPAEQAASGQQELRTSNHLSPDLHLFLDDQELEKVENLQRVVNRPKKHGTPIITADKPWEASRVQAWGSVIVEPDGLLRIWYISVNVGQAEGEYDRGGYGYAESRDGIHWTKPDLGIVEFRGSKSNNLFYTFDPDGTNLGGFELARRGLGLPALDQDGKQVGVINNFDGVTVIRDEDEPDPQKRYKLIANGQDHRMWTPYYRNLYPNVTDEQVQAARDAFGQYMDTSPDGIHWTRKPRRISKAVGGDYMMVMCDERNRRWWLNERHTGQGGNNAALRTSKDLRDWSELTVVFGKESDPDFGKFFSWHGGMTPFNYGNLNLGFLEKWPLAGFGATSELVYQREGKPWRRVAPGTPFLDVGPEGAFDRVMTYSTHNPPIRLGDKLYIFYTGAGARIVPNRPIPMSIGLATLGADRFVSLASWRGPKPGLVVTKPLEIARPRLEINVESFELNPIRVAVSTADGEVLPGYGFDDCRVEYDAQRVYTPVQWKDHADLRALLGQSLKLHFEIEGAAIYSFRFQDDR